MHKDGSGGQGFTIVELLVVIVVIGILAAITVVSYMGITQRAKIAALQSDLSGSARQLQMYYTDNGSYPTGFDSNNCFEPAFNNMCYKPSDGNSFDYTSAAGSSPQTYILDAVNGTIRYRITESTTPSEVAAITCPTGFIVVPGSATYGTSDFCAMKYEARDAGSSVPISQATGSPWETTSQVNALTYSQTVAGCTSCHLITEAEWLTIAQNVLGVDSNWSGGAVGTGYIYSGHNDGIPNNALAADTNDANGYSGTGQSSPSNQRRTLTLSNGEVIWDLAGNLHEWTAGQTTGGQPGIISGDYAFREWSVLTTHGTLSPDPFPATTGISGASGWTNANGAGGRIYSSADNNQLKGFLRGGSWTHAADAGVLMLTLYNAPTASFATLGFRVAAPAQ